MAGSLNVGVSKSSTLTEQDPAVESGPSTRSKAAGKRKDEVVPDDDGDDMYVTEEGDDAGGGVGDITLEGNAGGEGYVGEDGGGSVHQSTTTTTSTTVVESGVAQGQHQQGTLHAASDIPMAIDPALEALQVPRNYAPQVLGGGTDI